MAYLEFDFESAYLQGNTQISVILPDKPRNVAPAEFYGGGKKYRVLWLLHGTFGDHSDWIRKSRIELFACERDLVVVMPSGLNANYANGENFSIGYNMYDYFFEELMPLIYGWFPVSRERKDNFIAGLSMGGRGTCVYAFNRPELFAGAAVLSAAPRDVAWDKAQNPGFFKRTQGSIDNRGGLEKYLASYENTWRAGRGGGEGRGASEALFRLRQGRRTVSRLPAFQGARRKDRSSRRVRGDPGL